MKTFFWCDFQNKGRHVFFVQTIFGRPATLGTIFAQIFRNFARIFHRSKFGGEFEPPPPSPLGIFFSNFSDENCLLPEYKGKPLKLEMLVKNTNKSRTNSYHNISSDGFLNTNGFKNMTSGCFQKRFVVKTCTYSGARRL